MNKQQIGVYEKDDLQALLWAEKISESRFKLLENDAFDNRLNLGAIIETHIKNGAYEFVRVIEDADYITRRFSLTTQFKESEYLLLGNEIVKHGGHWETTLWGIAIVNLPKDFGFYFDEIFKTFNLDQIEIKN